MVRKLIRQFSTKMPVLAMTLGFMIVIVSCTQKVQSGSNITKKPAWLKEVIVMAGSNQEAFLFGTRSGRLMTQENAQSQHS